MEAEVTTNFHRGFGGGPTASKAKKRGFHTHEAEFAANEVHDG